MPDDIAPTPTPTPPKTWIDRDRDQASTEALVELVCAHVASGGTLIDLSEQWLVPMGKISAWVRKDEARSRRYADALMDQTDWYVQTLRRELKRITLRDIRLLYDDSGKLRPIHDWPAEIAACVSSVETEEVRTTRSSKTGDMDVETDDVATVKKVHFESKLVGLKLLGPEFGMFKKTLTVDGKLTLEQLLDLTKAAAKEPVTAKEPKDARL